MSRLGGRIHSAVFVDRYAQAAQPASARAEDVLAFLGEFTKALQHEGVPLLVSCAVL